MPALSDYVSGTITLTNGSNAFTGTGTGWQAADFREGDTILGIEDHAGVEYVIASITGNGAGTLTQDWEGATGTYTYRMRYMADGARVTAQARNLIELLGNGNLQALAGLTLGSGDFIVGTGGGGVGTLAGGNLQAEAGLTGAADTLSYYTGPAAKALTPLTAFARTLLDDANAAAFYATLGQIPNAQVRSDLPPDKAFRRGNILGTVSQSSGVPTGAIIERGSNANGGYVRFADGTQICTVDNIAVGTLALQNSPIHAISASWTFPSTFAFPPVIYNTPTSLGFTQWGARALDPTTSQTDLAFFSDRPRTDVVGSAIAIGRWF